MPGSWSDAINLGHGFGNGSFKSSPSETSVQLRLRTIGSWAGYQFQLPVQAAVMGGRLKALAGWGEVILTAQFC